MAENKKVGLVLGAGGARGYAHIGLIEVLLENDIPIDIVTGCSMGALIGGLYASGCDMYILEKFAESFDIMKYADVNLKTGGFIGGRKLLDLIRMFTKGKRFDETVLPYACVAVDIGSAELKTFNEGYLHDAIRASISIPGAFAPYEINGRSYIDGGVLERMPIDAAKDLGADVILACDVNYRGWEQKRPKNLVQAMELTMNIPDWKFSRENEKKADVLMVPDVRKYATYDFDKSKEITEKGRIAALEKLDDIKRVVFG